MGKTAPTRKKMTESSKIEFRYRRVSQVEDITDLVAMLFPGNQNQQHAAARILLELKGSATLLPSVSSLEQRYGISRRTIQRTRAKLANLGLIDRVSWMNARYGGQEGWRLSNRMSGALRQFADKLDRWRKDTDPGRIAKDQRLVGLLQ